MEPTELNETSEDILMGLVQASVDGLNGQTPDVQPLAPFITLQLLHRLHELIVQLLTTQADASWRSISYWERLSCEQLGLLSLPTFAMSIRSGTT